MGKGLEKSFDCLSQGGCGTVELDQACGACLSHQLNPQEAPVLYAANSSLSISIVMGFSPLILSLDESKKRHSIARIDCPSVCN